MGSIQAAKGEKKKTWSTLKVAIHSKNPMRFKASSLKFNLFNSQIIDKRMFQFLYNKSPFSKSYTISVLLHFSKICTKEKKSTFFSSSFSQKNPSNLKWPLYLLGKFPTNTINEKMISHKDLTQHNAAKYGGKFPLPNHIENRD